MAVFLPSSRRLFPRDEARQFAGREAGGRGHALGHLLGLGRDGGQKARVEAGQVLGREEGTNPADIARDGVDHGGRGLVLAEAENGGYEGAAREAGDGHHEGEAGDEAATMDRTLVHISLPGASAPPRWQRTLGPMPYEYGKIV